MNKRIRTRLLIIVSLLGLCVYLFAGFPPDLANIKDRIHLGLDLKGGMELILRVVTDDAVRADTDQTIETVRSVLQKENVHVRQIVRKGNDTFLIDAADPAEERRLRSALSNELADWDWQSPEVPGAHVFLLKGARVTAIRQQAFDQAMSTIRNRIDQFGVTEPVVQRYGGAADYEMLVQLPGIGDMNRIKEVIQ
jgi:preprotein translocase subunit SecD